MYFLVIVMEYESVIEKLLKLPEIVGFHYDDRDWSVGRIDRSLFDLKSAEFCVDSIERMKGFLEVPYIEDVFGRDDISRTKWIDNLSQMGEVYEDLRDVNILCIGALNSVFMGEGRVSTWYLGNHADALRVKIDDCSFLMPSWVALGRDCKVNREEYNAMGFEEKRAHVYEVKENVFDFLSCLARENSCRRCE